MLNSLKVNWLIERTNRKNFVALFAIILIVVGCMFYIKSQELSNQIVERKGDYYSTKAALSKFQVQDATEAGDGSEIYKNLTKQRSMIALQIAGLTTNKYEIYYEASSNIAKLRDEAFSLEGYEKVAEYLPSKVQNTMDLIYFEFMIDSGYTTISNLFEYAPFLLFFFSSVGVFWYIFVSFYTSSLLLDDFGHTSLIKGFPIQFNHYILAKCTISFCYILLFITFIFLTALPLLFMNGLSSVKEYVAVYTGEVELYTSVQYIVVVVGFMLVIGLFAMLVSIISNVLLKNMYLTLFLHIILFSLPILFPRLVQLFPYNPYNFMNINDILRGVPMDYSPAVDITVVHGLGILLVSISLMLIVIRFFFSSGKINRI